MLPFSTLLKTNPKENRAIYLQLADQLIRLIQNGTIPKGYKLPGSRKLAETIQLNRQTIIAAYEEVENQAWIESIPFKGTYVRNDLPIIQAQSWSDLPLKNERNNSINSVPQIRISYDQIVINRGSPDDRLAPIEAIARAYRSALKSSVKSRDLINIDVFQHKQNEKVIANYLNNTRGLRTRSEEVLLTQGSQMGIYLSANTLLKQGDHIAVGQTSYKGADGIFESCGAKLIHIDVDGDGIIVDQVEEYCKKQDLKCLYVTPHHHLPTTVTLSAARRMKLMELANTYNFYIIEDDYDFDFHYTGSPILPLASSDSQGRVIYVGSMSKIIAPGIRFGYVVAGQELLEPMLRLRKQIDRYNDLITARSICNLVKDGEIDRHLRKSLRSYKHRRDHFCDILESDFSDTIQFTKPSGGLAIWAHFDGGIDLSKIAIKALKKGLIFPNGKVYQGSNPTLNATRLGFASLNEKEMEKAFGILKELI